MLSSALVVLLHVDVKVSGILAFIRLMRRRVGISRLLGNHHFDTVAADHLTVQEIDGSTCRLTAGILHVAVLPACNA